VRRRNARFDAGRGVVEFDRPCLSVGNLSVGGTGKTPMVAAVVGWLIASGRRPAIAMRGYAARGGESDEAEEYRRRFPGLPVVARPDRVGGLLALFHELESRDAAGEVGCIVLDDGFQHRRIARQLDIVLLDSTRSPFEDRLLPAGWLREPVSALARAHALVATHAESAATGAVAEMLARARGLAPGLITASCRHAWGGLIVRTPDGVERGENPEWLRDRDVTPLCAIGNPGPFVAMARRAARLCADPIIRRDHALFEPALVKRLSGTPGVVLTTEKDWSRLRAVWPRDAAAMIVRPRLTLVFDSGERALRDAVERAAARMDQDAMKNEQ
jgi:tetraacyldisaccharide 4'-kinase